MKKIKIFIPPYQKNVTYLSYESPLLQNISDNKEFLVTDSFLDSDFFAAPYTWNYYSIQKASSDFQFLLEQAKQNHKKLIIFSNGDFTANIPFSNIIIFQLSAYKSRDGQKDKSYFRFLPSLVIMKSCIAESNFRFGKKEISLL